MKKFREAANSDGDAVAAADPSSLRNRRCIPIDLAASLTNLNLDPKVIIRIEDLPPGSLLSCGQGNSNNSWSLKLEETDDVVFIAPQDDTSDSFPISVRILMPDPDGFDYASTIHKFDILLSDTATHSAFTAIQPEDGKAEPAQLGALKDALAKARGLGDIKLNKKNALNFDEESAKAFEGQRSSASLQALFSAEQKEEDERRRIKDAEEEWRAHEERRLAEARADWMIETEAKVAQAVAETRMQEEQKLLAAEARFREQLTEKLEDAKARWKAKSASRGTGAGRAAPADLEATLRIRMTAEENRLQQEAAQKIADAETKFRAQLVEKLGEARKEWQADETARLAAAQAAWQAEEANRLGQAKLQWLSEIEVKSEESKPATDEIEAVVKERLASSQAKWQRDALDGLAQAEAKWKEAEAARLESARREWQSDTERRLQEAVAGVPQVDVEQVVRERMTAMQTRWQTEALNAISDAEARWKKAEKEKLDAARKEWQDEKERILRDMASAVPAVDLEGIVIERMRAAQAKWQEEAVKALVDAEARWKAGEADRIKAIRAEMQKEFDSRIKEAGSLDIDVIVQKKMAASQQKWQEEFLKVIDDSEKKWKAGEAERLKEAKAQWERDLAAKSGSGAAASGADIEKQVKSRVETEIAVMEAVWRSEEAQRLKAAEKEFGKQFEKKFAELELQHLEDQKKLHAAEAKLVELQGAAPTDAKAQRAAEQERLAAAEKEWAATAEKRLKSAEEDWKAGEALRLKAAEAAWKSGEQQRLLDARTAWMADEEKRRQDSPATGGQISGDQLKAAEAAWKAAEETRFKEAQAAWKAAEERHRADAEAAWRAAEQKRLDEAHITWQTQTERRFALIEKQVKDYQTQQAVVIERQVADRLAAAEAGWKAAEAERLRAARAEWEMSAPTGGGSGGVPPEQVAELQRQAVAAAEQKLREQMLAMEDKTRIRVADELVEAQRFWQEAADLKLAAERAQWQAEADKRIAEAESKAKFDPEAQAKMVAEVEARLKAEHAAEMDAMRASIDAMMAANAQRLEKEHSQRIAVMESQWRNSAAHTANEARTAAFADFEQRIGELARERDEALARLAQQPAAEPVMSADRVTLEIRIAQLETERDAAVRRAEDAQRNLALREEAQSKLATQSDSQLAAAVAAERMKWQAEAEQRVAAERREKEQAVELLKLAEARLRAMPTVDPNIEAKWKAEMEMRVAQTRAALTADATAAMQAAEAKWKAETDQRFAIAEEMFKEIYEEQLTAAEAKWRADENQRFAAAREAWMAEARTKGLTAGGDDSSLASSIEAALNAKFELKVADMEARLLAQREAAIAEARRQWESSEIDRLIDAQSEFQVNADRRMKELEIRLKAQFAGQINEAERLWKDGEAKRLAAARAKWKAESDDRVLDAENRVREEYERLMAQGSGELRTGSGG